MSLKPASERLKRLGHPDLVHHNTKHGMSNTSTYNVYRGMLARCYRESHRSYKDYGGRGITVCDRWLNSFQAFLEDMGFRPAGMSIEREDNSKGYSKGNCCWATAKAQARNRRSNTLVEFRGEQRTIHEWAEIVGINLSTVKARLLTGWSAEDALTTPATRRAFNEPRMISCGGKTQTAADWSRETGIQAQTITARLDRYGWSTERALSILPIESK